MLNNNGERDEDLELDDTERENGLEKTHTAQEIKCKADINIAPDRRLYTIFQQLTKQQARLGLLEDYLVAYKSIQNTDNISNKYQAIAWLKTIDSHLKDWVIQSASEVSYFRPTNIINNEEIATTRFPLAMNDYAPIKLSEETNSAIENNIAIIKTTNEEHAATINSISCAVQQSLNNDAPSLQESMPIIEQYIGNRCLEYHVRQAIFDYNMTYYTAATQEETQCEACEDLLNHYITPEMEDVIVHHCVAKMSESLNIQDVETYASDITESVNHALKERLDRAMDPLHPFYKPVGDLGVWQNYQSKEGFQAIATLITGIVSTVFNLFWKPARYAIQMQSDKVYSNSTSDNARMNHNVSTYEADKTGVAGVFQARPGKRVQDQLIKAIHHNSLNTIQGNVSTILQQHTSREPSINTEQANPTASK
jgi:hypothetical protein